MNQILDKLNELIGESPGLLPMLGIGLIILNFLLQFFPGPGSGWFIDSNLLLHVGLLMSLIGILLIRPLS
jgi:hypothetical protein